MSDIQRPIQRHLKGCGVKMLNLLENVDAVRKEIGRNINQKRKSEMGQFMTPSTVARFMVSLFSSSNLHTVRLLDAGAGIGSLSGAFLDSIAAGDLASQHVEVVAYEIDDKLRNHLSCTLKEYQDKLNLDVSVLSGDFIEDAVNLILKREKCFTHAILNPPYKKINSMSHHRLLLRQVGIETV
jgi:predicted RNA methylase